MVSQDVGFDGGKLIHGRKRFLSVDTLGLVLRVFVTAANVGFRSGGKRVLKRVNRMGKAVSRLHTIWADGGFDGEPFMRWVMDVCRWIVQVVLRPKQSKGFVLLKKRWDALRTYEKADELSPIGQRPRVVARNFRDIDLPCHDPDRGETVGIKSGIKSDFSKLFKHHLSSTLAILFTMRSLLLKPLWDESLTF